MKKLLLTLVAATSMSALIAQIDSVSTNKVDTIKVGNYVIIKKNKPATDSTKKQKTLTISSSTDDLLDISIGTKNDKKKNQNLQTNWWIFDLGFANVQDHTNYNQTVTPTSYFQIAKNGPVTAGTMNLINKKSSNFNIWFFMQKLNLSQHKLNLKWGLGYEQFNFRYENSLSFRNNDFNYIYKDSISFSKNKLFVNYLTIPLMLNYTNNPNSKKSFNASVGASVGYLLNARNKQVSNERGKQKTSGNFDLETFKVSLVGEIGLGPIRVYGSYSLNNMFKSSTGIDQTPFAFGIRFSRW